MSKSIIPGKAMAVTYLYLCLASCGSVLLQSPVNRGLLLKSLQSIRRPTQGVCHLVCLGWEAARNLSVHEGESRQEPRFVLERIGHRTDQYIPQI